MNRTSDYGKFKLLLGNRHIRKSKIKHIAESIKEYGWRKQPILVNDKYEIIDGQHRFEALKSLNMPIEYVMDAKASLAECQALNMFQSNWTVEDYINSYAENGQADYINFRNLCKSFPKIGMNAVLYSISEAAQSSKSIVTNGGLICSLEQYSAASDKLAYLNDLIPYINKVRGRIDYLSIAILFVVKHEPDCKLDRFKKVITTYYSDITPVGDVRSALLQLERLYNYKCKSKLMNFANDYSEYCKLIRKGTKHSMSDKKTFKE